MTGPPMTAAQAAMALQASRQGEESENEQEPLASTSDTVNNSDGDTKENRLITDEDYDSELSDVYNVEEIRAKRTNPRTGKLEYLIKWENYPESQNSWEPSENLNCPDVVQRFNEREKARRKRLRNSSVDATPSGSAQKKARRSDMSKRNTAHDEDPILVEENSDPGSLTETLSSGDDQSGAGRAEEDPAEVQVKGFARGLPLRDIIGPMTDDRTNGVWFLVRWKGVDDFDLVEVKELETNAPRELCVWYRRSLHTVLTKEAQAKTSDTLKS